MKKWCLAALALASTALTATFAQLPTGYGLHYSPQELAVWRQRAVSGPYKALSDVSPYSPGDWNRIVTFANTFKADPYNAGNDNLEARHIWTGWTIPVSFNNEQVPVWQGFKMQAAGFYYLIKGDTSYGNAVRRSLLHQITIPAAQIGAWDQVAVSYEAGFFEANWLCRILTCYDYTKDLFTAAERTRMENWFRSSATYFCARMTTGPIGQCFPKRLQDDYTVVSRDAQAGGIPSYADPIYPKSTAPRHLYSPDGYIYTHVKADGTMGNRVSRLAMHYNNRGADKMSYVGQLGVMLNDAFFKLHAKQYAKEFLKYSVYPDGTYGEYERNGDYGNVNQGFQYGAKNVAQYVILADALARKGDFSLYQYVTSAGAHNTVGGPKSLLTLLTRFANNFIGADPIYYAAVTPLNRIDHLSENSNRMAVWDYLLAVSNKYYKSDFLKNVYKRTATGSLNFTNLLTSVGGVYVAWNGPGGETPGFLFMNGQLEELNVYQYTCGTPASLTAQAVAQTTATVSWDPVSLVQNYSVRYRVNGATAWTTVTSNTATFALTGLTAATAYQVQVQTNCQAGNLSAWSSTLSFTTAQPTCPAPQNFLVASVTDNSAIVDATPVAGAIGYTVDLRMQGATAWTSTTVSALPFLLTLAPGTTYEVRIRTNCSASNSSLYTTERTFTTGLPACQAPGGLQATTYSTDSASMAWGGITGASQYKLRFKPVSSSNWKMVVVSAARHSEGSLLSATRYEFQVMTDCQLGNSSAYSGSAFFTTGTPACPAVAAVAVNQVMETTASVSYTSTGTGVLGYQIRYRKIGAAAWTTSSDAASPLVLAGLTPSTQYEVQARALCAADTSGFTASVNFTTLTPPCPAVTGVAVASITETAASVSYASTGAGVLGYQIRYRRAGATAWTTVNDQASPLALPGLTATTNYEVQARALCAADTSSFTASVNFTTATPPCTTPTGFAAGNLTINSAGLAWVPVSGATGYEVQYRIGSSGGYTTIAAMQPLTALSGLEAGTEYQARVRSTCAGGQSSPYSTLIAFTTLEPACELPTALSFTGITATQASIRWTMLAGVQAYTLRYRVAGQATWTTVPSATAPHALTSLMAATQYEVQVQATCSGTSESGFTQSVTFSTIGQVCYTPINLTAVVEDEDSVYITWSGIPGNRGYAVTFTEQGNPAAARRTDTVSTHRNGFTGFTPGRQYSVSVVTLCAFGTSYASTSARFTMPSGCNANGTVRKEIWSGMSWQAGQPLPTRAPESVHQIGMLEDSSRVENGSILARVKGYICPPATGNYTFYLSGTDVAEMYLATAGDSTTRQRIAFLTHGSAFRQFSSQPSATSAEVRMVHGQRYYLEVVYASVNSVAHFSLAWKTPESESVRLVSAGRFTSSAGPATPMAIGDEPAAGMRYALYPNPSTFDAPVYIAGPEGKVQVSVSDATGKLAWQGSLNMGGSAEALPTTGLKSGLYLVQVSGKQGQRQTLRMVVR